MGDPLPHLRWSSLALAISTLLMWGVTFPLNRLYGMPTVGMIGGMVHGVFFMLFVWFLVRAHFERDWPTGRLWYLFLVCLVPVWPFFVDKRIRQWIAESRQAAA